jgi:hypothetical protein
MVGDNLIVTRAFGRDVPPEAQNYHSDEFDKWASSIDFGDGVSKSRPSEKETCKDKVEAIFSSHRNPTAMVQYKQDGGIVLVGSRFEKGIPSGLANEIKNSTGAKGVIVAEKDGKVVVGLSGI